jgi:hypothetical protein
LPPSLAVSTAENGNMYLSITENVIRDISDADTRANMLVIDVTTIDVTDSRESGAKPKLHTSDDKLHEEDLILCKTDLTDTEWYLTEIDKIYSDEVEIIHFTTPNKVVENYIEQSIEQRSKNLRSTRFRKTWFIRDDKMPVKEPSRLHLLAIQNCDYGQDDFQSRNLIG